MPHNTPFSNSVLQSLWDHRENAGDRAGCARHPGRRDVGRGAAVHKGSSGGLLDANTVRPVTEGGQGAGKFCFLRVS